MVSLRPTVEELLDRFEILELFDRYTYHHDVLAPRFATGDADGSEFDVFDEIFTSDAVLDFSASGGIRAELATMKEWLPSADARFPVQHHLRAR
ncbi:MAG: nuclear transport factor 2 family protein [Acidimicrobiales bacterium]